MNNYAIFATGMIFGGFLGMAALSLVFTGASTSFHHLRYCAWSALIALDKGSPKQAMDALKEGLGEEE